MALLILSSDPAELYRTEGAAYIVFGSSGISDINLASTNLAVSEQGFQITGTLRGDRFGWSVCGAGDFNKDSNKDLIIGAREASSSRGATYLFLLTPGNPQYIGTFFTNFLFIKLFLRSYTYCCRNNREFCHKSNTEFKHYHQRCHSAVLYYKFCCNLVQTDVQDYPDH